MFREVIATHTTCGKYEVRIKTDDLFPIDEAFFLVVAESNLPDQPSIPRHTVSVLLDATDAAFLLPYLTAIVEKRKP